MPDYKARLRQLTPYAREARSNALEKLRQALLEPPIYADLAAHFAEKKLPEASILGNFLYHNHQIIASAKQSAAV